MVKHSLGCSFFFSLFRALEQLRKLAIKMSEMSRLDPAQVKRAVEALIKFEARRAGASAKADLLEDGEIIHLQLGLKRAPLEPSPKPRRLDIPHSLHGDAGCEMCLLVKVRASGASDRTRERAGPMTNVRCTLTRPRRTKPNRG